MMDMRNWYDLGHFRLLELIGRGGYANVYRAVDLYLEREVAIKVLKVRISPRNAGAIKTQSLEARVLAHLRHPHIVAVLEFNIEKTTPYIVMEYAKNGSLRDIHPLGERLEWPIILDYLEQITEALTFIHLHNIVHLDIKPGNMLMNENYEILVGDFGTVALIGQTEPSIPRQFIGTVDYAAPERFVFETPTPASDIYSLAVVVFEWFTGEQLFTGSQAEIIRQHSTVKPSSKRMSSLGISRPIQGVLLKALAKDPDERYQSASDFFDALCLAIQETEKRHVTRTILSTVLLDSLIAAFLALLLHSMLFFCIALPILLIISSLILLVGERIFKK